MSLEDDEGENGTIYNANIGTDRQVECVGTIDVISTREIDEGTYTKGQKRA